MSVLLDTNILTRSVQPSHPMHQSALNALSALRVRREDLCIIPQNLIEFWAVATRPQSANGLEMTTAQTQVELGRLKSFFRLLNDNAVIYDEWERLVAVHAVSGKNTYDARLIAAMIAHGITTLLTFNGRDFKRYPGITIVSPLDF
jgi:predicted nucleic acid-binding protein